MSSEQGLLQHMLIQSARCTASHVSKTSVYPQLSPKETGRQALVNVTNPSEGWLRKDSLGTPFANPKGMMMRRGVPVQGFTYASLQVCTQGAAHPPMHPWMSSGQSAHLTTRILQLEDLTMTGLTSLG